MKHDMSFAFELSRFGHRNDAREEALEDGIAYKGPTWVYYDI